MLVIFKKFGDGSTVREVDDVCEAVPRVGDTIHLDGSGVEYTAVKISHSLKRGERHVVHISVKKNNPVAGKTPYVSYMQARTYATVGADGRVFGYADVETEGSKVDPSFNVYAIRSNVSRYRRKGWIYRLAPGRFKLTEAGVKVFSNT